MSTKHHNLSQLDAPLPSAADMKFGIVVAEWNREITEALLEGAVQTLRSAGCSDLNIQIKYVPGTFELTLGTQFFVDRAGGKYGNKGNEAAAAAIQMVKLQTDMEAASPNTVPDRKNIN